MNRTLKRSLFGILSVLFALCVSLAMVNLFKTDNSAEAWNYDLHGKDFSNAYFTHWQNGQGSRGYDQTSGKWYFGYGDVSNSSGINDTYTFTQATKDTSASDTRYTTGSAHQMCYGFNVTTRLYTNTSTQTMFVWEAEDSGNAYFNGLLSKATSNKQELGKTQYGLDNPLWIQCNWANSDFNWIDGESYTIGYYKVTASGKVVVIDEKTYTSEYVYLIPTYSIPVEAGDKLVVGLKCNTVAGSSEWATNTLAFMACSFTAKSETDTGYKKLFDPMKGMSWSSYNWYFSRALVNGSAYPDNWALHLHYKAGHTNYVYVDLPVNAGTQNNITYYAMWLNVSNTSEEYSFSLSVRDEALSKTVDIPRAVNIIKLGDDGTLSAFMTETNSRLYINGFKGWLLIPMSAFQRSSATTDYKFRINVEKTSTYYRNSDEDIYVSSIGAVTDLKTFMYSRVNSSAADAFYLNKINKYVSEINAFNTKTSYETSKKASLKTYYENLSSTYASKSKAEKLSLLNTLESKWYDDYYDLLAHDIISTDRKFAFSTVSDTHINASSSNTTLMSLMMEDINQIDNNTSAIFNLGDLSDTGVPEDAANVSLDNYYDFIDANYLTNASGQKIPWYNVLGNHDVRGPASSVVVENYTRAVAMYKQREGVTDLCFEVEIGGYHFLLLNTCEYQWDYCRLSNSDMAWIESKLQAYNDGKPVIIMVHQPITEVYTEGEDMGVAPQKFRALIANYPNTLVISGHTHNPFGLDYIISSKLPDQKTIIQDGAGVWVNQPSLYYNYYPNTDHPLKDGYDYSPAQYFYVEVYDGGIVLKARDFGIDTFYTEYSVAIKTTSIITVNNDNNKGTVTGITSGTDYTYGTALNITVVPKKGYKVVSVTYGGSAVSVTGEDGFTFTKNASGNAEIVVTYGDKFAFEGTTVSLGTDISANFYVFIPSNYDNLSMRFIRNGQVRTVSGIATGDYNEYKFVFIDIAPQCMGDNIQAELLSDGEVVLTKNTFSVESYLKELISNIEGGTLYGTAEKTAKLSALAKDVLVYGGAAQSYVGYNTDHIVSDGITGSSYELPETSGMVINNGEGVTFNKASVFFDVDNKIRVKFACADITGVTVKIDGTEAEIISLGDGYYVETDGIYATEFDNAHTFEAYVNGTLVSSLTYKINSYVVRNATSENINLKNLVNALYMYGVSAEAYIG